MVMKQKKIVKFFSVFGLSVLLGTTFLGTSSYAYSPFGGFGRVLTNTAGGPGMKNVGPGMTKKMVQSNFGVGLTTDPAARIYVSKYEKVLVLYKDNKEVARWDCEMGRNTLNADKTVQGDASTPLGTFYICTRNAQSDYYLSLGLSYPDIGDAKVGLEKGIITQEEHDKIVDAINNKLCPPWNTALGGAIMIHGNYQKGIGTSGCVTVPNEVMDILWQYGQMGIRVDIGD